MNLIIQGGALPTFLLERIVSATGASAVEPRPPQVACLKGATRTAEFDALIPLIEAEKLDWAFAQPGKKLSDFGLICFDMDSTLITIECIDELADFAGKKAEVSEVTEAAMRGEIDYRESLRRRLALLAGLDARVLARVFGERLLLSQGARELLEACQNAGLRTAILSGGFTYFTERLRIELGFDFATSNELEISGGKLTGKVVGDIVERRRQGSSHRPPHRRTWPPQRAGHCLRRRRQRPDDDGPGRPFGRLPRQTRHPRQGGCGNQLRRTGFAAQSVRVAPCYPSA